MMIQFSDQLGWVEVSSDIKFFIRIKNFHQIRSK